MSLIENTKVRAYELPNMNVVGVFESINQAARKLYIKAPTTIWSHLTKYGGGGKTKGGAPKGVSSKKTGKVYQFEVVK